MPVRRYLDEGSLIFVEIDPAETSAGSISDMIRRMVGQGVSSVILDSLSGYRHALRDENYLLLHMHELLTYLNNKGVLTLVVLGHSGVVGASEAPFDISYLADAVLLMRYFEAQGEMRCAVSVIKKRTGSHERIMREIYFDGHGVQVGPRLAGFRDILSSRPVYEGSEALLGSRSTPVI